MSLRGKYWKHTHTHKIWSSLSYCGYCGGLLFLCVIHNHIIFFKILQCLSKFFLLVSCVDLIPRRFTFTGSDWRVGELFLYQSYQSSVARVCPAAGSGSWPLSSLRGMCNRDVQEDKYIFTVWREGCLMSVRRVWLWWQYWWYPAGLPLRCKMAQSFWHH